MVNCGIKKYDELPSAIGFYDIDYMRSRLRLFFHPIKIPLIKHFYFVSMKEFDTICRTLNFIIEGEKMNKSYSEMYKNAEETDLNCPNCGEKLFMIDGKYHCKKCLDNFTKQFMQELHEPIEV